MVLISGSLLAWRPIDGTRLGRQGGRDERIPQMHRLIFRRVIAREEIYRTPWRRERGAPRRRRSVGAQSALKELRDGARFSV